MKKKNLISQYLQNELCNLVHLVKTGAPTRGRAIQYVNVARFFVIHIVIHLVSSLAFLLHNSLKHKLEKHLIQRLWGICD